MIAVPKGLCSLRVRACQSDPTPLASKLVRIREAKASASIDSCRRLASFKKLQVQPLSTSLKLASKSKIGILQRIISEINLSLRAGYLLVTKVKTKSECSQPTPMPIKEGKTTPLVLPMSDLHPVSAPSISTNLTRPL